MGWLTSVQQAHTLDKQGGGWVGGCIQAERQLLQGCCCCHRLLRLLLMLDLLDRVVIII